MRGIIYPSLLILSLLLIPGTLVPVIDGNFDYLPAQTVHDPITISSEENLTLWGWPGLGTKENPYRIEDLSISAPRTNIHIENTVSYIWIKDCLLDGFTLELNYGIHINNASNIIIEGTDISDKFHGVYGINAVNISIKFCNLHDNRYDGIYLRSNSDYPVIANNTITLNGGEGIELRDTNYAVIENNTINENNYFGIWMDYVWYSTIRYNTFFETGVYSLRLDDCSYGTFANNSMFKQFRNEHWIQSIHLSLGLASRWTIANNSFLGDCDASISFSTLFSYMILHNNTMDKGLLLNPESSGSTKLFNHDYKNNLVQGKPLVFLRDLENTTIDASVYGQIILVDSKDVLLENGDFTESSVCVALINSENCTITKCDFYSPSYSSILLSYSSNCTISDNIHSYGYGHSLYLYRSQNTTVSGNSYSNSITHINDRSVLRIHESDHSIIRGNTFYNTTGEGIELDSSNITIENNVFSLSRMEDIGIYLIGDCKITNNTMHSGFWIGGLDYAEWDHIIQDNTAQGKEIVYLKDMTGMTIDGSNVAQVILVNMTDTEIRNLSVSGIETPFFIAYSENTRIENSYLQPINDGITSIDSPELLIQNVTVDGGANGFDLMWCNESTILNCSLKNTGNSGIHMYESNASSISNSSFISCQTGIWLRHVDHSSIIGNEILYNDEWGIYLDSQCENNAVYYNKIGWNTRGNAEDDGAVNLWDDDISRGNAWSDYSGSGVYDIPGDAGSVDRYPEVLEGPSTTTTTGTTPSSTTPTTGPVDIDIPIVLILAGGIGVLFLVVVVIVFKRK
jgi:parallel beta-helix repeat protein